MRLGLLAILIGVMYLFRNLGLFTEIQWNIIWPIIVIYLGIAMVVRDKCWHCNIWHDSKDMRKRAALCDCDECAPKKHSK